MKWTKKFVDIYGYECDFYCPYCKDRGTYHCCLSLGYCYCSCEAGQNLKAEDSYLAGEAFLTDGGVAEEIEKLEDESLSIRPENIDNPNSWNS